MVDAEQNTLQLVMEQIEELVVTLIEEIRERPGVAAAILAAVVGAVVGSILAARSRRRVPKVRAPKQVRSIGDVTDLARLGLRLLENPLVRGVLVAQLKRRLAF